MQQATLSPTPSPSVFLVNGRPATTSLEVAKFFGKRHDNVVRDIESVMSQTPENFLQLNFEESAYEQKTPIGTKQARMFILYRDGFMLLVMGYTGKQAMQIKIAYIEAFNAMEAVLMKQGEKALSAKLSPIEALRAQIDALRRSVRAEKERIVVELMAYMSNGNMGASGFQRYDVIRGPVYMMLEEIIGTGTDAAFKYNNPCDLVIRMKQLLNVQTSSSTR